MRVRRHVSGLCVWVRVCACNRACGASVQLASVIDAVKKKLAAIGAEAQELQRRLGAQSSQVLAYKLSTQSATPAPPPRACTGVQHPVPHVV